VCRVPAWFSQQHDNLCQGESKEDGAARRRFETMKVHTIPWSAFLFYSPQSDHLLLFHLFLGLLQQSLILKLLANGTLQLIWFYIVRSTGILCIIGNEVSLFKCWPLLCSIKLFMALVYPKPIEIVVNIERECLAGCCQNLRDKLKTSQQLILNPGLVIFDQSQTAKSDFYLDI
jgi:hypothetical protein